ncbi:putative Nuclear pore complex protein Nup133 [Danaus plexippus plexippus]|uniref:Nuclear pore complex protein Nup133 n=1 Tax=Danaus plexippus plexippus TaxID=278856 RepID=A0A212EVZ1_DANPL|nr:putative Nuclear pore complex protein Nup133 [Danaus plexippus plexippus]
MEFNSTGGMRSPFSPRVRQSISGRRPIGLGSAKKNSKFMQQSEQQTGEIVYKTPFTTLETFGTPLPVMVTETLTFPSSEVSVRLSSCGWCWAVCGRKVLAWPWDTSLPAATARDLTLPQTDLAHKADLVVLFYENDAQLPSCIGVSPEGVVRYWSSVGAEGASCDVSCELAGQECDRLIQARDGLLLATTTCTLVRITTTKEARPSVVCHTLRPPSGWLGGLGRRVSVLFFGSMPANHDTKLVKVVLLSSPRADEQAADKECVALVAGGPLVQLWEDGDVREVSLRRPLCDALARTHLAPAGELSGLEVAALDAEPHPGGGLLLLLLLTVAAPRAPDARYALAHVSLESEERVRVLSAWCVRGARSESLPRCLPLQPPLVYNSDAIIGVAPSGKDQADVLEVSAEGDSILGASQVGGRALVFTRRHGVLLLRTADPAAQHHAPSLCDSPLGSPCPSDVFDGNLTLYEIDPNEVVAISGDAVGKLKSAFLYHVRGQQASAAALLSELAGRLDPSATDRPLDRTVVTVTREMLDDAPAGDPRWKLPSGAATRVSLGSSCSLQAAAQLHDKQKVYNMFLDFLRSRGLWRRLGTVTGDAPPAENGEGVSSTQHEVCALGERLAAARALQRLHQAGAPLVDAALHQVAAGLERAPGHEDEAVLEALRGGALSAADVCWRRVSRVLRVLTALCSLPPPPHDARAAASHAHHALVAVNSVMSAMQAYRSQCDAAPPRAAPSLAPHALLPSLCSLHTRAVTECARKCPDASLRSQLLEEASSLARSILLEAEPLAEGRTAHLYEKMRSDTIQPYLAEGQAERAAVLAEKFKDFELLIQMCVDKNDLERLDGYMDKYEDEGFPEKTFAWLASRGGRMCALLVRSVGARVPRRLESWLAAAPDRLTLRTVHALARGELDLATELFAQLADNENVYVNRMADLTRSLFQTAASLSKLCSLAGGSQEAASRVCRAFSVVRQHRALPAALTRRHALDQHEPKLFTPEELIQMYIESESRSLTEYDYKKALDLTELVTDLERRDDLRLKIWCACIRQDDWSRSRVDAPELEMKDKMFFRLLDLVHLMGGELDAVLPPLEAVVSAPELESLAADPRALYLLKYGYQCVATQHDDQ